ncbi:hypothetical protein C0580_03760 [Candidatus Parcubacteria bacterium]|nr:MAG: hypothetical protein C0580_03760 [Candidatus Parcubacteria bacterium]
MSVDHQKKWQEYKDKELKKLGPIFDKLGFALDREQVHIGGERYVSGDKKLVLLGKRINDNKKVVIKVSSDREMIAEIKAEYNGRKILEKINFAYYIFLYPEEILFVETEGYTIFVTEFIEQNKRFIDRPLKEQFFLALKSFEAQEAIQATTYEHAGLIKEHFGFFDAHNYLQKFDKYSRDILTVSENETKLNELLSQARKFLVGNKKIIDLYSGFLVHWDFVPHNLRIADNEIYLLDHSSLRFGNKYESWARFINFMALYNPELESVLLGYVKQNRGEKELLSLRLMRVFRLSELIWYYTKSLEIASGDLLELNKKRIDLWTNVLSAVLSEKQVSFDILEQYRHSRDSLRDREEKKRQEILH